MATSRSVGFEEEEESRLFVASSSKQGPRPPLVAVNKYTRTSESLSADLWPVLSSLSRTMNNPFGEQALASVALFIDEQETRPKSNARPFSSCSPLGSVMQAVSPPSIPSQKRCRQTGALTLSKGSTRAPSRASGATGPICFDCSEPHQ
jgi:hypothetical protein